MGESIKLNKAPKYSGKYGYRLCLQNVEKSQLFKLIHLPAWVSRQ